MTHMLKGLVVAFDEDLRAEDAEAILNAIKQIRHVADVTPVGVKAEDWINRSQVRTELWEKIFKVFEEHTK
jgi:hypothetical protein